MIERIAENERDAVVHPNQVDVGGVDHVVEIVLPGGGRRRVCVDRGGVPPYHEEPPRPRDRGGCASEFGQAAADYRRDTPVVATTYSGFGHT